MRLQAFLFVVFGIYFTWFWARGQTLAMKTWDIAIVDRAGRADLAATRTAALSGQLVVVSATAGRGRAVRPRAAAKRPSS